VLTIFIMTVLMTAVFMLILFLHTFTIDWKILLAILYIFFELCLMTAVALLFRLHHTHSGLGSIRWLFTSLATFPGAWRCL